LTEKPISTRTKPQWQ